MEFGGECGMWFAFIKLSHKMLSNFAPDQTCEVFLETFKMASLVIPLVNKLSAALNIKFK